MRCPLLLLLSLLSVAGCDTLKGLGDTATEARLIGQAEDKLRKGEGEKAIALYREAAEKNSESVTAQLALAKLLQEGGRTQEALAVLEAAATRQPKNADVEREIGNTQIVAGRGAEALAAFERAIAIADSDARAYNGRGVALDMLKRHGEAQASYRKALGLSPADTGYIENNLALSLVAAGEYKEAVALLKKLAEGSDAAPQIRQNLAMAYALSGDMNGAREWSLKDLPKEKAEANLAFYKQLAETRRNASDKARPVNRKQTKSRSKSR